jgi:hypothetical protein
MHAIYGALLDDLTAACHQHYGGRLVSLGVFGSVGRGAPHADSDIDVLLIAEDLPPGRMRRVDDFGAVEAAVAPRLAEARTSGLHPTVSPVLKTPTEVEQGSLLFLDMLDDLRLLHDRDGFMARTLAALKARLERLGAKRIWRGNAWFWDLKPDYKPGEVFEI